MFGKEWKDVNVIYLENKRKFIWFICMIKIILISLIFYSLFKLENSILVLGMGFKEICKRILLKYRIRIFLKV